MPTDADDVREYADPLRRDAVTYFDDVELYFRCQDEERREVFEQARELSEDYPASWRLVLPPRTCSHREMPTQWERASLAASMVALIGPCTNSLGERALRPRLEQRKP